MSRKRNKSEVVKNRARRCVESRTGEPAIELVNEFKSGRTPLQNLLKELKRELQLHDIHELDFRYSSVPSSPDPKADGEAECKNCGTEVRQSRPTSRSHKKRSILHDALMKNKEIILKEVHHLKAEGSKTKSQEAFLHDLNNCRRDLEDVIRMIDNIGSQYKRHRYHQRSANVHKHRQEKAQTKNSYRAETHSSKMLREVLEQTVQHLKIYRLSKTSSATDGDGSSCPFLNDEHFHGTVCGMQLAIKLVKVDGVRGKGSGPHPREKLTLRARAASSQDPSRYTLLRINKEKVAPETSDHSIDTKVQKSPSKKLSWYNWTFSKPNESDKEAKRCKRRDSKYEDKEETNRRHKKRKTNTSIPTASDQNKEREPTEVVGESVYQERSADKKRATARVESAGEGGILYTPSVSSLPPHMVTRNMRGCGEQGSWNGIPPQRPLICFPHDSPWNTSCFYPTKLEPTLDDARGGHVPESSGRRDPYYSAPVRDPTAKLKRKSKNSYLNL